MGIELSSNTGHTEKLGPTTGKQQVRERVRLIMSSSSFFIDQSLLFPQSNNGRRNSERQKSMVCLQIDNWECIAWLSHLNFNF